MGEPEKFVGLFPDLGESEYKDDCHGAIEENTSDSRHCLEKPVTDVRHNAWRDEDLFGHTLQVLSWLSGDVVEVDEVANGVDGGEEEIELTMFSSD